MELLIIYSWSLASLLFLPSHAKVRLMTHRMGDEEYHNI